MIVKRYLRRDGQQFVLAEKRNKRTVSYKPCRCCVCGVFFFASRKDARYCSAACKQRRYRQRRAFNRQRHEEKLAQLKLSGIL